MKYIYSSLLYIGGAIISLLMLFTFSSNSHVYSQSTPPSSNNYQLSDYGFGSGGTASSSSNLYSLFGTLGQVNQGSPSSANYFVGAGLEYEITASAPAAPIFTNPGQNYDRLLLTINPNLNPSDYQYAVMISSDDYQTIQYIQNDGTLGSTLGPEDFLTYSGWGGASGTWITGLSQSTTYKVRAKSRQGSFYTESWWGPQSSSTTSLPSLTFGVSADTITFNNLNTSNSYTDSSQFTTVTTSTNAYNGYIITGYVTQPLTKGAVTITNYSSPNSNPTTWAGTGFGYTTNDSDLSGGTPDRFTNGGPNYAGFTTSSPGDPVADHAGPVTTPISNEQFTISYRITAASTQEAGKYTTTAIYIVTPEY